MNSPVFDGTEESIELLVKWWLGLESVPMNYTLDAANFGGPFIWPFEFVFGDLSNNTKQDIGLGDYFTYSDGKMTLVKA